MIKIRVAAMDEGKLSESDIVARVADGVVELRQFLALIESLMLPKGYAFGEELTWADFFLYPLLADLRATREGELISERLKEWLFVMDKLEEVKGTVKGTLEVGGRPGSE